MDFVHDFRSRHAQHACYLFVQEFPLIDGPSVLQRAPGNPGSAEIGRNPSLALQYDGSGHRTLLHVCRFYGTGRPNALSLLTRTLTPPSCKQGEPYGNQGHGLWLSAGVPTLYICLSLRGSGLFGFCLYFLAFGFLSFCFLFLFEKQYKLIPSLPLTAPFSKQAPETSPRNKHQKHTRNKHQLKSPCPRFAPCQHHHVTNTM
jgi:hypothetical protein